MRFVDYFASIEMDSCDLKVMCLAVSGKYLFSADYEGNVRSWALGTLTAVGSTVSVFVNICVSVSGCIYL